MKLNMFSETQRKNSSYFILAYYFFPWGPKVPSYLFKINYVMLELDGSLEIILPNPQ